MLGEKPPGRGGTGSRGWWELLQGRSPGLGEGTPSARCGSTMCDPGQVHLLGGLLLCDRRGLGRCPPKALPSLAFCPQRGRSCCPSRPLLCLLIPCCPSPVSRQVLTAVNLFRFLQRGDPGPLLWSLLGPTWDEGHSSSSIPSGIQSDHFLCLCS